MSNTTPVRGTSAPVRIVAALKKGLSRPSIFVVPTTLVFGVLFSLLTPPLWGLDEPGHVARVIHILDGDLVSNGGSNSSANTMPNTFNELFGWRVRDITDSPNPGSVLGRRDVTDPAVYDRLLSARLSGPEKKFPSIANYSVVAYPGPIIGVALARVLDLNIGGTLLLARIFSLISFTLVTAIAIRLVERSRLAPLFVAAALVPTSVFQGSVVTADTLLLPGALIYLALLWRVMSDERPSRKLLIGLAAVTVLLPLVKLTYILLTFLSALVTLTGPRRRWRWVYRLSPVMLAIAGVLAWAAISQPGSSSGPSQRPDGAPVSPSGQLASVLQTPLVFARALVTSLIRDGDSYYNGMLFTVSGNGIETPLFLTIVLSVVLVICGMHARSSDSRFRRYVWWTSASSLLLVASVFGSLYLGFSPVGALAVDGVQGRYFTTILVPVALTVGILIPARLVASTSRILAFSTATAVLALTVSTFWIWLALW